MTVPVLVPPGIGDEKEKNDPTQNEQYENPRPILPQL